MNHESLTPEQIENAKAEELLSAAKDEGVELSDEEIDAVAGGYLFHNDQGLWEVVNIKGNVRFTGDYKSAYEWADKNRYSTYEITWKQLNKLRHGDKDIWD